MVIYLDVLAVVNGAIDYLLLRATARLAGLFPRPGRLLGAAALGAALAVGAAVCPAAAGCCAAAGGLLLPAAAFGWDRERLLRLCVLFLLAAGTCAGVVLALARGSGAVLRVNGVYYLDVPLEIALAAAALCWGAAGLLFRGGAGRNGRERPSALVTITYGGKTGRFLLLRDTGSDLCDPLSGRPALLLRQAAAERILPDGVRAALGGLRADNAAALLTRLPPADARRFCLLPYRAVGTAGGFLLALRADRVVVDGAEAPHLVAIAAEGVGGDRFDGLIDG